MSDLLIERRPSQWRQWLAANADAPDEARVVAHFLHFLLGGDDGLMGGLTPGAPGQDAIFYAEGGQGGRRAAAADRAGGDA